jgi:glycosyltransferase involved in cell wall biosynthesis
LASITVQTFDPNAFEVIVVNNGSTDDTAEICNRFGALLQNFIYCHDAMPGLLTGRHKGVELSSGEILSFIDDDVELNTAWLKGVDKAFQTNPNIHLLTGPNLPKYETEPPTWLASFWSDTPYGGRYCTWLSLMDLGNKEIDVDPLYVWGLNFSIRRTTFHKLGGFHPDNIPAQLQQYQGDGETGLALKAKATNCKALYTPSALLYHYVSAKRMTENYFKKRAFYQGVCDSYTSLRRNNNLYPPQKVQEVEPSSNFSLNFYKRVFAKLTRIANHVRTKNPSKAIRELHENLNKKYNEGFEFHQKAYSEIETVREWVLKENYWDYKLPTHG